MAVYECTVCQFVYDETKEGTAWVDLADDWECPVCGSSKKHFSLVDDLPGEEKPPAPPPLAEDETLSIDLTKTTAETENDFSDIILIMFQRNIISLIIAIRRSFNSIFKKEVHPIDHFYTRPVVR